MVVLFPEARLELLEGPSSVGIQHKLEMKYKGEFVPYKTFVQKTFRDLLKQEDEEREKRFREEDEKEEKRAREIKEAPAKKVLRKALLKRLLRTRLAARVAALKAEKAKAPAPETKIQQATKFFEGEIEKLKAPPKPKKKAVEKPVETPAEKPKPVIIRGPKVMVKKAKKKTPVKPDE